MTTSVPVHDRRGTSVAAAYPRDPSGSSEVDAADPARPLALDAVACSSAPDRRAGRGSRIDDAAAAIYGSHMPGLTKTTLYLKDADYRRLKALAEREGRAAAELVREAVSEYASRRGARRLPRSLGVGRSGRGDVARKAERLLEGMGRR
jgi:hypothetical protein